MANLLYVTPRLYSSNKHAGGMGTKTTAILNAWGVDHVIDVSEKIDPNDAGMFDFVILELLGLRNGNKLADRIEALKLFDAPILVHGSDSELLRWEGKNLDMLKEVVTIWMPNTTWQSNYFRDFDLPVSEIVFEPIDCDLFRPAEKEKVIIAGGAISYEKNSDFFVRLFEKLKGNTGYYRTEYIGGHIWGGKPKPLSLELRHEMKQVVDVFHGEQSPSKVSSTLGAASVGVLCPHYETCNRFDMELMASGVARVCSPHICYDERPVARRFDGTVDDCIIKLKDLTHDFAELPDESHFGDAVMHAYEYWSYDASLDQLNSVLRIVG